jgi:non-heme chloroperoxidase
MPWITVGKENTADIQIHYQDQGEGPPVILIHGWPLSGRSWEKQIPAFIAAGYRVINYDRRGFGLSSQPAVGYDYDTLAGDLSALVTQLELDNFALVGFSMGGGEVARYVGRYGAQRVRQAVFIASVTPYLRQASDNPEGLPSREFEKIQLSILADRPAFLLNFFKKFYNDTALGPNKISDAALNMSWLTAVNASPIGSVACVRSWGEDFRQDLRQLSCPTLVIHGSDDQTVPFSASAKRMPEFVKNSRLEVISGAPHGLTWTHAVEVNQLVLDFLDQSDESRVESGSFRPGVLSP